MPLRLGTRGSELALWQARAVVERLTATGGHRCEIVIIKTSGDKMAEAPLSEVGGKRLFVKEIEDALIRGEIDLAVHSAKDMPAELLAGLQVAAVLPREDPRDVIVLPDGNEGCASIDDLPRRLGQSPRVGTSSVRRVAQMKRLLPGARFEPIRGNLDTRLRKLDRGDYDALVLAAAGLHRLGFGRRISLKLPVASCVPAPGQGIVAVETRKGDGAVRDAVGLVNDVETAACLEAERALVLALGGGCQTPIGGFASPVGHMLELQAVVVSLDGATAVRGSDCGLLADAGKLGERLGRKLAEEGAAAILQQVRGARGKVEGLQP
jgi:hydroxymethylbilane synthase